MGDRSGSMTGDACAPDLGKHSLRHAYLRSSTFSSSHSMPDIASDLLRCTSSRSPLFRTSTELTFCGNNLAGLRHMPVFCGLWPAPRGPPLTPIDF